MASRKKVTISWSGGKDAAFSLYKILQSPLYEVVHLHTLVDSATLRVGMHGVPVALIKQQAEAIGLPLKILYLEKSESNEKYALLMKELYQTCKQEGIEAVVFGDIFLEDLRTYREALLATSNLEGIYPLWKQNTTALLSDFINAGFKTLVCCANTDYFSEEEIGKTIDHMFIEHLSHEVDPCGERGEFHTFVYDGPLFKTTLAVRRARVIQQHYEFEVLEEDGTKRKTKSTFWFQELLPLIAL